MLNNGIAVVLAQFKKLIEAGVGGGAATAEEALLGCESRVTPITEAFDLVLQLWDLTSKPAGLQIVAPATFKSYEDFFFESCARKCDES